MSKQILTTKIAAPPPLQDIVLRPRLTDQIHTNLRKKITLISAPIGYGKTTLLTEWIQTRNIQAAWLSLDEYDNEPWQLFSNLIGALQLQDRDLGKDILVKIQSPKLLPMETILGDLINQISLSTKRIILILDDYHQIENQNIHQSLEFFLKYIPRNMHIIISSRIDPPLSLSRLLLQDQLLELRANDLRFTLEETVKLFTEVFHLNLSNEDIRILEGRTEGWAAGLLSAALLMLGRSDKSNVISEFSGRNTYLLDLQTENVFKGQSEIIQSFLMQTSVVEEFNSSLCNALICEEGSRKIIDTLCRFNLFIVPLDDERKWFRYHQLFRDFLRRRMIDRNPHLIPVIYERASAWYEQNNMFSQAVSFSLASKNYERAADLIEKETDESDFSFATINRLATWINHLPKSIIYRRSCLCITMAWRNLIDFDLFTMETYLEAAEEVLKNSDDVSELQSNSLGEISTIRAIASRLNYDVQKCIDYCINALELIHEENLLLRAIANTNLGTAYTWSGNLDGAFGALEKARILSRACGFHYIYAYATKGLAGISMLRGDLQKASRIFNEGLEILRHLCNKPPMSLGIVHIGFGELLYEWDELEKADENLTMGIQLSKEEGDELSMVAGCLFKAFVKLVQGEKQEASSLLDIVNKVAHKKGQFGEILVTQLSPDKLYQLAIFSDSPYNKKVLSLLERIDTDLTTMSVDSISYIEEIRLIAIARKLIARREEYRAISILEGILPGAEQTGRISNVIDIYLLMCKAHYLQNNKEQALECLRNALDLAEPGGYIRKFLNVGSEILILLKILKIPSKGVAYIHTLLKAFEKDGYRNSYHRELEEPLTKREIEVLQLLAIGLSNQEIAENLVITISTAKKHVSNIIGKFGVKNRTEAAAKSREYGLQ